MQRFLKFRSVLPTRIFGITSGSVPIISVKQNFLTLPFLTNRFIIAVLLLTYLVNSEKEYKLVRARLLLVNSLVSYDVINSARNKCHIRELCPFFQFFGGNFSWLAKRGSRLEARARRLASSQNSLLPPLDSEVILLEAK